MTAVPGLPEVCPGDDLAALLAEAIRRADLGLVDGDALVVCQKVVSKAEDRIVDLRSIEPTAIARRTAGELDKDERLVTLILREARRVIRMQQGHLIAETSHGFVCANAGIDESNSGEAHRAILLPLDPDGSAARLRADLATRLGRNLRIVVSDTFGRAWREGQVDVAIGAAGFPSLLDHCGRLDRDGRELHHSLIAIADQLAAAAGLLMAKSAGLPAVIVSGVTFPPGEGNARSLARDPERDLFR